MCCAIVAILLALFPAWTGGRDALLRWFARARWLAVASIAAVTLATGTAIAADHVLHQPATWIGRICGVHH